MTAAGRSAVEDACWAGVGAGGRHGVDEPHDPDRSRLLLLWLQARRALDHELGELRAAGPAGERRVRARFDRLELLEQRSAQAYADYRHAVRFPTPPRPRLASAAEPEDDLDAPGALRPDV